MRGHARRKARKTRVKDGCSLRELESATRRVSSSRNCAFVLEAHGLELGKAWSWRKTSRAGHMYVAMQVPSARVGLKRRIVNCTPESRGDGLAGWQVGRSAVGS